MVAAAEQMEHAVGQVRRIGEAYFTMDEQEKDLAAAKIPREHTPRQRRSTIMQDSHSGQRDLLQLVTFTLGREEFGVEILKVQEIIRMMGITRVPKAPDFVEGVINLRGKVIPIIDLRKRFGLQAQSHDKMTRIVVVEINDAVVGFIVDAVSEVLRIPVDTVEPAPPLVAGIESEYISGVGKLADRLLILLDLNRLLSDQEQNLLLQV